MTSPTHTEVAMDCDHHFLTIRLDSIDTPPDKEVILIGAGPLAIAEDHRQHTLIWADRLGNLTFQPFAPRSRTRRLAET